MIKTETKTILTQVMTAILFISALLGLRWLWTEIFSTAEHPNAVHGVLDMRGWNFEESPSIPLNGEWEF